MEPRRDIVHFSAWRTGAALLIAGLVAVGIVGISHAVIAKATAASTTRPMPAGVAVPARRVPDDDRPSEPPADAPPSSGDFPWYTFFQAFSNVPNNEERVVHCGRNYPYILSGYGLVIPTLAGYQVSSHAVYNPDGWAFSAHAYFGRTVSFNVFATCASEPRG